METKSYDFDKKETNNYKRNKFLGGDGWTDGHHIFLDDNILTNPHHFLYNKTLREIQKIKSCRHLTQSTSCQKQNSVRTICLNCGKILREV